MPTLIASVAGLLGVAVWVAALRLSRASKLGPRRLLLLLLAGGLVCRVSFALFTPLYNAPDEHSHMNFVRYLDAHGRLPVQEQLHRLEPGRHNWEYHQPPLYYLLMAPLHRLFHGVLGWADAGTIVALRLVSVAIWLATALVTLRLLRHLELLEDFRGVCVMAGICLLPTYLFITSVVNNDGLAVAVSVCFFLCLARARTWQHFALAGALIGLAIWSKQSGVVLGAAAVGTLAARVIRRDTPWRQGVGQLAIVTAFALAVWAPVAIRHLMLYGSVTGGSYYYAYLREDWTLAQVISFAVKTFVASAGGQHGVTLAPAKFTVACAGVLGGLMLGSIAFRRPEMMAALHGGRAFLWGGLLALLLNAGIMVQIGLISGTGQGRHLFPVLIPICLLAAATLQACHVPQRFRFAAVHVAGLALTGALAFTAYSLAVLGPEPW